MTELLHAIGLQAMYELIGAAAFRQGMIIGKREFLAMPQTVRTNPAGVLILMRHGAMAPPRAFGLEAERPPNLRN